MLRDRKVLLEQEIVKLKAEAANMYLSIVVNGSTPDTDYFDIKARLADLEFDLKMITDLINQGHK